MWFSTGKHKKETKKRKWLSSQLINKVNMGRKGRVNCFWGVFVLFSCCFCIIFVVFLGCFYAISHCFYAILGLFISQFESITIDFLSKPSQFIIYISFWQPKSKTRKSISHFQASKMKYRQGTGHKTIISLGRYWVSVGLLSLVGSVLGKTPRLIVYWIPCLVLGSLPQPIVSGWVLVLGLLPNVYLWLGLGTGYLSGWHLSFQTISSLLLSLVYCWYWIPWTAQCRFLS